MPDDRTSGRGRAVPQSRLGRLSRFGGIAGGLAGGMMREGATRLMRGERPSFGDLLLTPANATRLTNRLAELRGAAMKMGQLLSMDGGELLPPELSDILARLRADAEPMPDAQLAGVLTGEWGSDWRGKLTAFDAKPIAAASIGQVHRARDAGGRDLAVKIQYPGIVRSIDSDVDNVARLLRLSGLVPRALDVTPLLAEAKQQLREEADYVREAECVVRFRGLLADDERFVLPEIVAELTTTRILAMTFVPGTPLERLQRLPQATRDGIAAALLGLILRELFEFGWMQTDPNFANYRYDEGTHRIGLLDFGAARPVSSEIAEAYRAMLRAAHAGDRAAADAALVDFGLFDAATPGAYRAEVLDIFDTFSQPMLRAGAFDFGDPTYLAGLRDRGLSVASDRSTWRLPPVEALFVQRKISGAYHLAARLGARVDLRAMVGTYL